MVLVCSCDFGQTTVENVEKCSTTAVSPVKEGLLPFFGTNDAVSFVCATYAAAILDTVGP